MKRHGLFVSVSTLLLLFLAVLSGCTPTVPVTSPELPAVVTPPAVISPEPPPETEPKNLPKESNENKPIALTVFDTPRWQYVPLQLVPLSDISTVVSALFIGADGTTYFRDRISSLFYQVPLRIATAYALNSQLSYLAIDSTGKLYSLSLFDAGMLTMEHIIPEVTFQSVSLAFICNFSFAVLALTTSGEVWQMEVNPFTHEGTVLANKPRQIDGLVDITAVSTGWPNTVMDSQGRLWQWGLDNTVYDAAENYRGTYSIRPQLQDDLPRMRQLHGVGHTFYAIAEDGSLWLRGFDQHGLLETEPARLLAMIAGPSVLFYPFYNWTRVPLYDQVISLKVGDVLMLQTAAGVFYHRINGTDFNLAQNVDLTAEFHEMLTEENRESGMVFYWLEGLSGGIPMLYPMTPVLSPVMAYSYMQQHLHKPSNWVAYWANALREIIVYDDGKITYSVRGYMMTGEVNINGATRIYVNPSILTQVGTGIYGFYVMDAVGQLWMVSWVTN